MICRRCKDKKPLDQFPKNRRYANGHDTLCKQCNTQAANAYFNKFRNDKAWKRRKATLARKNALRREFGLSEEAYKTLHETQNGVCAICGHPETDIDWHNNKARLLAVDHNHITGKVRGLLCRRCNTGLGLFGDSCVVLEKAVTYLNTHE